MPGKTKQNYKLGIAERDEIIQLLKKNTPNKDIIGHLKKKYDIGITSGYISQIKQKLFFVELTSYNKQIEAKLRNKMKVDAYILHIIENGYSLIER